MKTNWQTKKLGDLGEYINGRVFAKSEWGSKGLPIIRIQNLNNENSGFNYCSLKIEDRYHVQKGDILISWSASLDVYVWDRDEALLNQHIFKVILDEEIIDKSYFVFLIKTKLEEMSSKTHGATMKHIVRSKFLNIDIELPQLKTQKEIVAKLDTKFTKLKEAKRLREEVLSDAEKILSQTLREIFEEGKQKFKMTSLGDAATLVRGPFGGSLKKEIFVSHGVAVYEQGNVIDNILNEFRYFVTQEKFDEMKRFEVFAGDILMSCSGTIGKFVIIPDKFTKGIINQALLKITPKKTIGVDYLKYALQDYLAISITHIKGGAIKNIASVKELKQFSIPLPSLMEQQKIVTKLEKLSEKIRILHELQTSQLADLKRLEKSYLREAFRGELV